MSDWNTYRLSDLINLVGGGTPKTTVAEYWNGDIPWLSVVDFGKGIKKVYQTEKSITEKGLNESSTKILKEGQIIISARGTVGELAVLGRDMAFNQSCYGIYANEKTENNFLYYLLKYSIGKIKKNTHGAVFDTITKQTFDNIEVSIPDNKATQRQIAQILSSLDDKIELNLQMNQTLEAMAQAIFKEWFVNFNFPGFDGELVDGLPKGWRVERFDNHFDVVRGLSYKGSGLATKDSGIPMYNLNSVYEGGGFKYEGIKFYNGEYKDKHLVRPRDIIVANTEQGHKYLLIGFPAVVPFYFGEPAIFSHHIYRLRPNENSYLSPQFTYYLLLQQDVREQIIGCSNGTTVNMLKIDGLQMPIFKVPPSELIQQFSEIIEPIWQRQENNVRENESLTQTRDTLLPKLMNGQLKVV